MGLEYSGAHDLWDHKLSGGRRQKSGGRSEKSGVRRAEYGIADEVFQIFRNDRWRQFENSGVDSDNE